LNLDECQIWPGKDYANSRASDFHELNKPESDMYDRTKIPRQPWHDIGVQLLGQPARDLCRHFVQRWNYLLRSKWHCSGAVFAHLRLQSKIILE
jgi:phospholipase D1/2